MSHPRGNRLSYSEVRTMLSCSAKWKFSYFDNLPSPKTVNQVFGTAIHTALATHFKHHLETGHPPAPGAIQEVFQKEFEAHLKTFPAPLLASLPQAESPLLLEALGETLLAEYLVNLNPDLIPSRVEGALEGRIGNIPMLGYPDLIARQEGRPRVIDIKTVGRSPGGISEDHRMQLALYGLLYAQSEGLFPLPFLEAELHVLNKTKAVVEFYRTTLTQADYTYVEEVVPRVARAIMDGNYYPNRSHLFCSRKLCPFWAACESAYGGQVRD